MRPSRRGRGLLAAAILSIGSFLGTLAVGVPAASAVGAPPEGGTASFNVDAQNNSMDGWGWVGGATVHLEVWDGAFATMLASATTTAELGGQFHYSFQTGGTTYDLAGGQAFVAWDGTSTKVLTDTNLVMTGVSYGGDFVEGTGAIHDGTVTVSTWSEWPTTFPQLAAPLDVTADGAGGWTANLGAQGVNIVPSIMHVAVNQADANGDIYAAESVPGGDLWPHLVVTPPSGIAAFGYAAGAVVSVHVVTPAPNSQSFDDTKTSMAQPPPQGGTIAFFDSPPFALLPGTVVTLTGPTPAGILDAGFGNRELVVTDLAINDVNLATSTVAGIAAPSTDVEVYPFEPGYQGPWVRRHTLTDGSGGFSQTFSGPGDEQVEAATLQMTGAGSVSVRSFDHDASPFDVLAYARPNVTASLFVDPNTDLSNGQTVHVNGAGFSPNQSSGVGLAQCVSGASPPKCTLKGFLPTDGAGQFSGDVIVDRWVQGVDVGSSPGASYLVAYDPGAPFSRNATVPLTFLPELGPLALTVDLAGQVSNVSGWATIHGTVTAPASGWVTVSGSLWQKVGKLNVAQGTFEVQVFVPYFNVGVPVAWTAPVAPGGWWIVPFKAGKAEAHVHAELFRWAETTTADNVTVVNLQVPRAPKPPRPPK